MTAKRNWETARRSVWFEQSREGLCTEDFVSHSDSDGKPSRRWGHRRMCVVLPVLPG